MLFFHVRIFSFRQCLHSKTVNLLPFLRFLSSSSPFSFWFVHFYLIFPIFIEAWIFSIKTSQFYPFLCHPFVPPSPVILLLPFVSSSHYLFPSLPTFFPHHHDWIPFHPKTIEVFIYIHQLHLTLWFLAFSLPNFRIHLPGQVHHQSPSNKIYKHISSSVLCISGIYVMNNCIPHHHISLFYYFWHLPNHDTRILPVWRRLFKKQSQECSSLFFLSPVFVPVFVANFFLNFIYIDFFFIKK